MSPHRISGRCQLQVLELDPPDAPQPAYQAVRLRAGLLPCNTRRPLGGSAQPTAIGRACLGAFVTGPFSTMCVTPSIGPAFKYDSNTWAFFGEEVSVREGRGDPLDWLSGCFLQPALLKCFLMLEMRDPVQSLDSSLEAGGGTWSSQRVASRLMRCRGDGKNQHFGNFRRSREEDRQDPPLPTSRKFI